jgi:hypothetical protein
MYRYCGDEVKKNEMAVGLGNRKALEDQCVDGVIILKGIVKK